MSDWYFEFIKPNPWYSEDLFEKVISSISKWKYNVKIPKMYKKSNYHGVIY